MSNIRAHSSSEPFANEAQRRSAALLGMWIFLATEVLFFGGLFVAYAVYRYEYAEAFVAGSERLNLWSGGLMTAILMLGSLLVAIADQGTEHSGTRVWWFLLTTSLLGVTFLALEFHEYHNLIGEGLFPSRQFNEELFARVPLAGRSAEMFFVLFFCMTGLHALHMIIGVTLITGMAVVFIRSGQSSRYANSMTVIALYWHFVDIVWVFLYPLFYLVR